MSVYMAPEVITAELRTNERLAMYFTAPGACAYRMAGHDHNTDEVFPPVYYSAQGAAELVETLRTWGFEARVASTGVMLEGCATTVLVRPSGRPVVSLVKACVCPAPAEVVIGCDGDHVRLCRPCAFYLMADPRAYVACDPFASGWDR